MEIKFNIPKDSEDKRRLFIDLENNVGVLLREEKGLIIVNKYGSRIESDGDDYEQVFDNQWVCPKRKNYKFKCCKCGLVHEMDFKLNDIGKRGKQILFRARRIK